MTRFCWRCNISLSRYDDDGSLCRKCNRELSHQIFAIAEECACETREVANDQEGATVCSRDLDLENLIDSRFYYGVVSRLPADVEQLRQHLFETARAPHFGADPERVRQLRDPRRLIDELLREYDPAAPPALSELRQDFSGPDRPSGEWLGHTREWWLVSHLADRHRLDPDDLWLYALIGMEPRLPTSTIIEYVGPNPFQPDALRAQIRDPRWLPKSMPGLKKDDWPVEKLRGRVPNKQRQPAQAMQDATHLIRTWGCFCLETLLGEMAKNAVNAWNERFADVPGLAWGRRPHSTYSGDKTKLRTRLEPFLTDDLTFPPRRGP